MNDRGVENSKTAPVLARVLGLTLLGMGTVERDLYPSVFRSKARMRAFEIC